MDCIAGARTHTLPHERSTAVRLKTLILRKCPMQGIEIDRLGQVDVCQNPPEYLAVNISEKIERPPPTRHY
jgi:hypothetical protein